MVQKAEKTNNLESDVRGRGDPRGRALYNVCNRMFSYTPLLCDLDLEVNISV